jgi:hypothetical protein
MPMGGAASDRDSWFVHIRTIGRSQTEHGAAVLDCNAGYWVAGQYATCLHSCEILHRQKIDQTDSRLG